ncbi:MAG: class I SAM-dependent methyltransferase [Bacteroidales bacterium]|nr:class I SAM-dependent methyltransferase [Bacteroidales bacterium]
MSKNISPEILILWPETTKQPSYTEYNFGLGFCKNQLNLSLLNNNITFNWHNYSPANEQINVDLNVRFVLIVKDPMVLINALTLISMMQLIDNGFDGVGPCFSNSQFPFQVGSPIFIPFNTSTYLELTDHFKTNMNLATQDVDQLDGICALFSIDYFTSQLNLNVNSKESYYLPATPDSRFGVLKNSYVFTFADSDDQVRHDLIKLVPENCKSLLDIGCSFGSLGKAIHKISPSTIIDGIEPNRLKAKLASQFYNEIFTLGIEEFPSQKKYDCIICGDVLEHLLDPEEQLKHISSFLNTSGYLIVSVPNAGHWTLVADTANGIFEYLPWGLSCITHYHWFTEQTIIKAIEDAGLRIINIERQQTEPSPKGKIFIKNMIESNCGNEQSLLTNEFIIKAIKE